VKLSANAQTVLAIGGVIIAIGFFSRKAVAGAVDTVANPNRGTAFEGKGVIGTVGNAANQASGGFFAFLGNRIARILDPNENKTIDELTGT